MRSKHIALTVFAILLTALAPAGAATTSSPTSLNVPAATYTIYPNHTHVVFAIRHMGLSTFHGTFGRAAGTLQFDPAQPEKSALNVQIDMSNIQTTVDELNNTLKDAFKVVKYPTATFVSTQIGKTGPNTGTVTGNLTIAGVTKPVTLNVTFNGGRDVPIPFQPYRIGFDATGTIKRSDFGLNNMIWSGFVSDEVTLAIDCEMEKK